MGNRSILALGLFAAAAVAAALLLPPRAQPGAESEAPQSKAGSAGSGEARAATEAPAPAPRPAAKAEARSEAAQPPVPTELTARTPAAASEAPRFDAYGDPLPPGAVARLGTRRFRFDWANDFVFMPSGCHLALVESFGVGLMDTSTGFVDRRLARDFGTFCRIRVTPDSKSLLLADQGSISRWGLKNGRCVWETALEDLNAFAFALSPDGRRVAATARTTLRGNIYILDAETGEVLRQIRPSMDGMLALAFSPDGQKLAAGCDDRHIYLIHTDSGRTAAVLRGHTRAVYALAFSPGGERLASGFIGSGDAPVPVDEIRIWDTAIMQQVESVPCDPWHINAVAYAPDGKTLFWMEGRAHAVQAWDVAQRRLRYTIPETGRSDTLRLSPDGAVLAAGGSRTPVGLFDAATGRRLNKDVAVHEPFLQVAFSPDGERIATADWAGGHVQIWSRTNGALLRTLEATDRNANSVCWSSDGKLLASATSDGGDKAHALSIWNAASGTLVRRWSAGYDPVFDMVFSPDGSDLVTVARRTRGGMGPPSAMPARVWAVASGQDTIRLEGKAGPLNLHGESAARFSPDGRRLAAGLQDGSVRIWELPSGKQVAQTEARTSASIGSLDFLPDGWALAYLDVAGRTGLHLWETTTDRDTWLLKEAGRDRKRLFTAAQTEDFGFVVAIEHERRLEFWQAEPARLLCSVPVPECFGVGISADRRWAVSWHADATALVWDLNYLLQNPPDDGRPDF